MVLKWYLYVGASLCRLCVSNVFGVRAGFGMDTSHIFPQGVLVSVALIRGMVGVAVSGTCAGCEVGLHGCHHPVRGGVCSPVVGGEALRVGLDQALLPLGVGLALKEVIAETTEALAITANYLPPVQVFMVLLISSPHSFPFLCCVRPRSSSRL